MRTNRLLIALLCVSVAIVCCGVIAMAMLASRRGKAHPGMTDTQQSSSASEEALPVLWDAPGFSYPDQSGRTFPASELRGHVWVANFIFTQCTAVCPTMTAKMVLLQHQVVDPHVRFVSFSVDPAHDTVEALAAYAKQWSAAETRWHLLRTQDEPLKATAEGFKVMVAPSGDADNPIMHSNYFFLMDGQGRVRGVYNSGDKDTMDRLAEHTKLLAAEVGRSNLETAAAADGKSIYMQLGCGVCHNNVQLGPPLEHLFGREIRLDDGSMRVADENYVRESILNPNARVVAGYRKTMPSYEGFLDADKTQQIIDYLRTLSPAGAVAPSAADVKQVTDPVCKMRITVDANSLHVDHGGVTHYFCSQSCLEKFNADPQKYLAAPTTTATP
jgi:protein SCO1/2